MENKNYIKDFLKILFYNTVGWIFFINYLELAKFSVECFSPTAWRKLIHDFMETIYVVHENDKAAQGLPLGVLFWWPGVQYQLLHKLMNRLWIINPVLSQILFGLGRCVYGAEIHPLATVGRWVTLDHVLSVIIGATAKIEDFVFILGKVTLGNNGAAVAEDEPADAWGQKRRHPWIRSGVRISDGVRVFGPVIVGYGAVLGGVSKVSKNVPNFAVTIETNEVVRFENPITGEKIPLSKFGILQKRMRLDDSRLKEIEAILTKRFVEQGLDFDDYYGSLQQCRAKLKA